MREGFEEMGLGYKYSYVVMLNLSMILFHLFFGM